jgi:ATP-dependent exoDNAse (exonuclease V) beta subunit
MKQSVTPALTAEQQRVVDHPLDAPGVVDAGAGTGKTFTIVERVAALHERKVCRADRILLLTFARKAAAELRARIARRLDQVTPMCATFHSFAWSVLQDHAYDVGLSPETIVLEDADARVEFKKAFDEYLADPAAASSGFPLRPYNCDEIREALFAIGERLKSDGTSIDDFERRALAEADAFGTIGYRELRRPYARTYRGQTHKAVAEIDDGGLARDVAWERQRVRASADILRRFAARLAARYALTYADILHRAEQALRDNEELRRELQGRYRCCIVDEYQDTDLAQHRLLEALFGTDLAAVMVVGDVLQSIFSFRGARPDNVEIFRRAPRMAAYPLLANRRSRQEILDVAHAAVVKSHDDAQPLSAHRGAAGGQVVHLSTLWLADDGTYLPMEAARELEAQAVARRVVELLHGGSHVEVGGRSVPIAASHIAILSRTKRNVQPVTEALVAAGVPFRLVGGVGFYDAPEIRDVLAWLRLLANPFDSHAVARALQSVAIGASDADLVRLGRGVSRDPTAWALRELLDALAPQAALPLLGALAEVIDTTGIARAYHDGNDPRAGQALANLAKLEALARAFVRTTPGAQPADFVAFMDELERIDFDEREADVSPGEGVTIATIHAAKGLEWPFVFVLGVWPRPANDARLVLDGGSGALLYGENPDGSRSFHYQSVKLDADAEGLVTNAEEKRDDSEERRLLYVALTRARDRVFISGVRTRPSKNHPQGKPHDYALEAYAWLHERGWEADEALDAGDVRYEGPAAARALPKAAPRPGKRATADRDATVPVQLSYSLIARYERCPRQATYAVMLQLPEVAQTGRRRTAQAEPDATDPADVEPADSLLGAGEYGQLLHKALELWALDKRNAAPVRDAAAYASASAEVLHLSPTGMQRRQAEQTLEHVVHELRDWQPVQIEAPFVLDLGEENRPLLVTGYLDLLARDANGRACVIDYKTGNPAVDHALQLALYQLAAARAYGMPDALCYVGQIDGGEFALHHIQPVAHDELATRVRAVRDGLLDWSARATPGAWCWTCGYRGAPCQSYPKRKAAEPLGIRS